MRPILFLDIDGVLNSTTYGRSQEHLRPRGQQSRDTEEHHAESGIDPIAVGRLNTIVDWTSCLVVLSSSWRNLYPLTKVTRMLRFRGFKYRLFAATPNIYVDGPGGARSNERGKQIDWWLRELIADSSIACPPFAIVDDDSDMEPWMSRLVQTDHESGLQNEHVDRLVKLLRPE